ncbi:hypothetical protein O6H91_17G050800 [Diphasiastrum complanatum]|uniref:Uncharacterized protein n=1 Tax=Diphasiastrum complanatum TaxID=34168 RepID=A0ACC2B6S5_DIPCM|nr:hypothetical protein O6H91_17G050800 [Diphasiastrum complanatum]
MDTLCNYLKLPNVILLSAALVLCVIVLCSATDLLVSETDYKAQSLSSSLYEDASPSGIGLYESLALQSLKDVTESCDSVDNTSCRHWRATVTDPEESTFYRCCRKRCVHTGRNRRHCGKCGRSCTFGYTCCKGKCINLMNDIKHCGSCSNKCNHGIKCVYGLCGYSN